MVQLQPPVLRELLENVRGHMRAEDLLDGNRASQEDRHTLPQAVSPEADTEYLVAREGLLVLRHSDVRQQARNLSNI